MAFRTVEQIKKLVENLYFKTFSCLINNKRNFIYNVNKKSNTLSKFLADIGDCSSAIKINHVLNNKQNKRLYIAIIIMTMSQQPYY